MNTILLVSSIMLLGIMALIFLYVFIKAIGALNRYESENYDEDQEEEMMEQFKHGLNRGLILGQIALYKMWIESGETVLVGSYENIKNEMYENFRKFFNSEEDMRTWNEKFDSYVEQTKDSPQ